MTSTNTPHAFAPDALAAVYRTIAERRDMRHFSGGTVAPDTLRSLLEAAHHAPSVGFMQPWRFIRVTDPALRQQLHTVVEAERLVTARVMGEREDEFMRLNYPEPMLQQANWAKRQPLASLVFENQ